MKHGKNEFGREGLDAEDLDGPGTGVGLGARSEESGLCARVLPIAASLVPPSQRVEWLKEWRAELWHLRHGGRWVRWSHRDVMGAVSLAYGMIADAAWLRLDATRQSARGTAASCLWMLAGWCVICAAMERVAAGSWHLFWHVLVSHFLGGYVFVAAPAVFASAATYPIRPLRCERTHRRGLLSARTRWNLFLAAKVVLTLALGFLACVAATAPLRMEIGHWADWVELPMFAVVVTTGLRWALLNQEQRCQKCLRMLGEPMRVGPASRNFLEWSGTELACADGHGLLHVPEMRGSWCWYDLWVEMDAGWGGLFGS